MSKEYTVTQAFKATVSKEDKTPKVVNINGHTFNSWKVKLAGEEDKGWININKKPENEIKAGDKIYGDVNAIDGKFGTFYSFKSASRPLGELPVASSASVSDSEINDKLDYIISILENMHPKADGIDLKDLDI